MTVSEVFDHTVERLDAGTAAGFADGVLTVDTTAVEEFIRSDPRVTSVRVDLVSPGDDVRMIHVLDSVRPVCNAEGPGRGAFPGMLSPMDTAGRGVSHRLQGVLVTVLGLMAPVDSFLAQQEGVLDLTGEGARLSPLAQERHVVVHLEVAEDLENTDRADAYTRAGLRVAEYLASLALDDPSGVPVEAAVHPVAWSDDDRARIVHICEVATFGRLFDTFIGGKPSIGIQPTFVTLRGLADGLVVSSDFHYAGQRNLTCFYQDDPVSRALFGPFRDQAVHAGTILMPIGGSHPEKERGAHLAATMAQMMSASGVVVTAVAAGNAHLDVMFAVRACEQRGLPTVLQLVEMAGPDGADPGMIDTVPEADLMVSSGNREQLVTLPARAQVLGGDMLIDPATGERDAFPAAGDIEVPLRAVLGVNNELGAWNLGARAC